MFCTNCGNNITNAKNFCPNCGYPIVVTSNNSASNGIIKANQLSNGIIKANQLSNKDFEELFWLNNNSTLVGLNSYCSKYPQGSHYAEAKQLISKLEWKDKSRKNNLKKGLKLILLILLIPVLILSNIGARWMWVSKIANWYNEDKWM